MNQFNTTSYMAILQYSMPEIIYLLSQPKPNQISAKYFLILADRTQARA